MKESKIAVVSVGSDPEMFLFKNGSPISSIGLIPGSKKKPHAISEHESVQVDNVAIEFNLKPSKSPEEFISSLQVCYDWAQKHLNAIDPKIQLMPVASVEFPREELMTRQARIFGCDPDFNAWEGGMPNPRPERVENLRSCGGHIHLGILSIGEFDMKRMVRLMDKHVGTYCAEICGDDRRREIYGKAGAYRPKPYGLEYRTPSISWVKSEKTIKKVFELIELCVEDYNNGFDAEDEVRVIINNKKEVWQTI